MNDGLATILDGNTFVVSDERGDIEASPPIRPAPSRTTAAFCPRGF
jgi:hypothetical protein